ncbi:MAG: primosomal protein N', partial [Acidobacteria bacterium]|nr:primosomal protein N' [Acidobacteriota bacterium]
MAQYCNVAVGGVPIDRVFTYHLPDDIPAVAGSRVVVPFRQHRLVGIVTEFAERAPEMAVKDVLFSLDGDDLPALKPDLLQLGRWVSNYYLAPLGEVFRCMLPLHAEFRRVLVYRIAEPGELALHLAGTTGRARRGRQRTEDELAEFRVLDHLAAHDEVREATLKNLTRVSRRVLDGMVRKHWILRADASHAADRSRTRQIAILKDGQAKLTANQKMAVDALGQAGGRLPVETLRGFKIAKSTLEALARRSVIELREEALELQKPGLASV